jgi:dual specificity phosphatase 12
MFTADKIDDNGVWLGDIAASENIQALDTHQISHILTILDYQPIHTDKNRTYLHIHAEDFQSTDLLTNEFEKCFQFIDKAIEQGHQVLIHCRAGISRSATIATMYLMRKYSLTREQALERLINKRRHWLVMPNDGFLRQLDLFHQMNYKVDIENESYKEFQRKLFDSTESRTSTNSDNTSFVLLDDQTPKEYKCRTCHSKLFTNNDIQNHEQQSHILCNDKTRIFTYFLDWIDEVFVNPIGAINCPNCKIILGEYSLQGIRCNCHQWIKPAFIFQSQSIE